MRTLGRNRKSTVRLTIAIAPAEHPAITAPRSLAARIAAPSGESRMPAREVHEVGLADGLQGGRVVALLRVAHQDRFDLGAEGAEMLDAHLGPDAEGVLAVGRGGGRQDHDARAGTAGGFEQPAVELCHRREELSGAHERHRSGHGRSIDQAAEVRSGEARSRGRTPGWTPRSDP